MKFLTQLVLTCSLIVSHAGLVAETKPPAEVMLFGVFHFANPGLDVIKTSQINVMTAENQKYLERLAKQIATFEPTVVLLEFNPENETAMQDKYRQFLEGTFDLPSNEVYQLGFRIAKLAGLQTIYSFDEWDIGWQAEALFTYMPDYAPETKARMDTLMKKVTSEQEQAHATKSLAELLLLTNNSEEDTSNKYMYLMTNHVGAGENFVGADATASWWHRNFRMYANIQKHALPGERVLAIAGQGHTAILKDLLAIDRDRIAVDMSSFIIEQ